MALRDRDRRLRLAFSGVNTYEQALRTLAPPLVPPHSLVGGAFYKPTTFDGQEPVS